MTATPAVSLSDLLNVAYLDGVDRAVTDFGLPASAAAALNNWIKAQEHVLELEDQAQHAARIADAIVDLHIEPLFTAAQEAA